MQAEQLRNTTKKMFLGNVYKNYPWFNANIFNKLCVNSMEFLNLDLGLKLVSVSEKDNVFFAGEDYFVTKIRITKDLSVFFRISKSAVDILLSSLLGSSGKQFEFEHLTELEAKVLTSYNDFLYKGFAESLIDIKSLGKKVETSKDCHLAIFINDGAGKAGRIMVSIPVAVLPDMPEYEIEDSFSIDDFPKTLVPVDLKVGTTKIALQDLKSIEVEDIVVLEESNITNMQIKLGGEYQSFKVTPDPSLIMSMDNDDNELEGGGYTMDDNITQNMWDSIQVDISAEFEQVKIPLGDLKQISEGLVVDIGSVYENKIDLKVENKVIASGELVIINDRYGIRVDNVVKDEQAAPTPQEMPVQDAAEAPPQDDASEDFNEEDFDYSNFEIEDEDI